MNRNFPLTGLPAITEKISKKEEKFPGKIQSIQFCLFGFFGREKILTACKLVEGLNEKVLICNST
jgi:hypothetical protein